MSEIREDVPAEEVVNELVVRHAHTGAYVGTHLQRREWREAELDVLLAPGATRPIGAGNRRDPEEPDPFRLCFERDLDRVKHSRSWRRLAGKCQVFIAPEDDHLRTRLTHAVEVAQVATGIARATGLCLPLTEAIALAHDCGHGPAGHASEEALSPYLPGGYDHAVYGADVTLDELNLCAETLDGIRNHSWRRPAPATPEGEVVAWADRIAYVCHDFEDAVRAGLLTPGDLPEEIAEVVGRHRSAQVGTFMGAVLDAVEATGQVGMREPMAGALAQFRAFNFDRIYLRPAARRQAEKVIGLLRGLVDFFVDAPARATGGAGVEPGSAEAAARAVRYVSGMTDRYALALGVELLGWRPEDLPRGVETAPYSAPMGILDEDVARVREVTDLVALASEHIGLKRVGRRFVGLCPFHSEKSPSFSINPEMGVFYCFGCQKSGDAITFVREVEHLDFPEAVERLAARAGITLRYDDASFSVERKRKQRLYEAIGESIAFYGDLLLSAPEAGNARGYLRSRGYDGDVVRRFSLGYAPDGYDALSKHLQNKKFARQDVVDAGLAFVNRTQKLQDQFRGRLMFPIWDARGEPVGFGGRTLDGNGPKYKNSPETTIYQKSRLLYGLHWAKGEIVARGEVVICEGYTDVMAFALAGVPTAVATCGTALADEHFLTLKNLARKVTLAYDADAAGQAAAERCYQWEQRFEVQFQVADLPPGRDPADVGRDDPEALAAAVTRATPFLEFRIDRLLAASDISSLEGRAHAAERAAVLVAEHPNDLVRDQYVMKLAGELDIDPDRLRETVSRARSRPHVDTSRAAAAPPVAALVVDRRELDALRWAVLAPELMSGRLDVELFVDPVARSAFDALTRWPWHECLEQAPPAASELLQRLAVEDPGDIAAASDTVTRVVVNVVEAAAQRLLAAMLRSGDERSSEVKALLDALVRERSDEQWQSAETVAEQLVGWITDGGDDRA